jgi:hypothetical protein
MPSPHLFEDISLPDFIFKTSSKLLIVLYQCFSVVLKLFLSFRRPVGLDAVQNQGCVPLVRLCLRGVRDIACLERQM